MKFPLKPDNREHHGKALTECTPEHIKIDMDCTACGKFIVEMPLVHLGSIIKMLTAVADHIGIDYEASARHETMQITETDDMDDPAIEEARRNYEEMDALPPWVTERQRSKEGSLWD